MEHREESSEFTRRDFMRRAAAFGAVTIGSSVLVACGGGDGGDTGDGGETGGAADDTGGATALNCDDPAQLTETEIQQRDALQYVEVSEVEGELCNNCAQWEPAESEDACGTCKVVPGPINPQGHCSVWVAVEEA